MKAYYQGYMSKEAFKVRPLKMLGNVKNTVMSKVPLHPQVRREMSLTANAPKFGVARALWEDKNIPMGLPLKKIFAPVAGAVGITLGGIIALARSLFGGREQTTNTHN